MAVNTDIFLGSGASLTFVPEVDFYAPITTGSAGSNVSTVTLHADITNDIWLLTNLYVGCVVDRYNSSNVHQSSHIVTSNTTTTLSYSPSVTTLASNDYFIIRSYGAPCPGVKDSSTIRLNADNWLGLVESATFPTVEQEMKQLNLALGSSRNFTHQYKGIRTASGGNIGLMANHGSWLYYALGKCDQITASLVDDVPTDDFTGNTASGFYIDAGNAGGAFDHVIDEHVDNGPFFYKSTSGKVLLPPLVKGQDSRTDMELLRSPIISSGSIDHYIEYRFVENNGEELPSFALEQNLSKLESGPSKYKTETTDGASESHNFVRIARGNRVNTLTLTANENEELKMTMDLNSRAVNKLAQDDNYEARGGQATDTSLTNFQNGETFLEPFFFSSGSFSIFGQQFLKVTNLTLTINNNLQDKRFVGIGNKDVKSAIPAQRTYELSFTAMVTDDQLFEELFNETEIASGTSTIDLQFDKANGEQIVLKFEDYTLSASNFTVPDDKGPITVEGTVMPRTLNTCTVKTHWILQG
tara:strand:- start:231 stop:1811 length:1581 start_codon:yes stop_codon:yes gene_type:complete